MPSIIIKGERAAFTDGETLLAVLERATGAILNGCGHGACGACTVLYRDALGNTLSSLACETPAVDNMEVLEFPYVKRKLRASGFSSGIVYAAKDALLRDALLRDALLRDALLRDALLCIYPALASCVECGACSSACPKGIDALASVRATREGDIGECARMSSACIMCGLCTAACPASIDHAGVFEFARRTAGAMAGVPSSLEKRANEAATGDAELDELIKASTDELRARYNAREIRL